MKSWLEFEERFRRIVALLQYLRIDFQWGAAGEHWRLCGMSSNGLTRQFDTLAELTGLALLECAKAHVELLPLVAKEKEARHVWYRALKELVVEASANLCLLLHARYPLQMQEKQVTEIRISNSTIGILNTGQIKNIESIIINIGKLNDVGSDEVANALKNITSAVAESTDLTADVKSNTLEQLENLSEQAVLPVNDRSKPGVIMAVFTALNGTLAAAGSLADIWSTWGAAIQKFFGF
ncbi:MAG: hypothetical protein NTU74_00505 [Deltaproteobacteria bacterium]|nr:hypothetical protein [Deltaproteobacteria bacterium]